LSVKIKTELTVYFMISSPWRMRQEWTSMWSHLSHLTQNS